MLRITLFPLVAILAALCTFVSAAASQDTFLPPRAQLMPGLTRRRHVARSAHADIRKSSFFKRQATRTPQDMDLEQWARETAQKCMSSLQNVTVASNPAGVAVCYNIPFLDPATGVFAADLRMYQVSPRVSDWENIQAIDVSLEYQAAAVQPIELNTTKEISSDSGPKILQQFNFLGQIKPEFLRSNAKQEELRTLLMPDLSLKSRTEAGTELIVKLASNEAFFVNGVFSELKDNNSATANIVAPAFVLPGTRIEIAPIGMIVFSVYMVIGTAVVMFGTFERRKFRDQYRRKIAASAKVSTI